MQGGTRTERTEDEPTGRFDSNNGAIAPAPAPAPEPAAGTELKRLISLRSVGRPTGRAGASLPRQGDAQENAVVTAVKNVGS